MSDTMTRRFVAKIIKIVIPPLYAVQLHFGTRALFLIRFHKLDSHGVHDFPGLLHLDGALDIGLHKVRELLDAPCRSCVANGDDRHPYLGICAKLQEMT